MVTATQLCEYNAEAPELYDLKGRISRDVNYVSLKNQKEATDQVEGQLG